MRILQGLCVYASSVLFIITTLNSCGVDPKKQEGRVSKPDNIFLSTNNWYVNRWWSENTKHSQGDAISEHSTAVWLNSVADIGLLEPGEIPEIPQLRDGAYPNDGFGLREHLSDAQSQGNALIQLVLHNLPGRDCGKLVAYGLLPANEMGVEVYRTYYIDRIAAIISDYPQVPVVIIVEPAALQYLQVNRHKEQCQAVGNQFSYGYVSAIRNAVNILSEKPNVHIYLDVGSVSFLGWSEDLSFASLFMHGVISGFDHLQSELDSLVADVESSSEVPERYRGLDAIFIEPPNLSGNGSEPPGYQKIAGFVANVADYVPLEEPYLGDPWEPDENVPLVSAIFYDWNPHFGVESYSRQWMQSLESFGVDTSGLGMLIDTSRNGWGQSRRVIESVEPITDLHQVDDYRLDQRVLRSNWCNQEAGIGIRPQVGPVSKDWIDAYVWVKPPGESDGLTEDSSHGNDYNYKHDPLCASHEPRQTPLDEGARDYTNLGTGAMGDAPHVGRWFDEGLRVLIQNAWPPLCEGKNDRC